MKILKEIFTPAPVGAEFGLFPPSPAAGEVFSVPSGVLFVTSGVLFAAGGVLFTAGDAPLAVSASPLAAETSPPVASASPPAAGDAPLTAGAPPLFIETTPLATGDTPLLPKNLLFSTIPPVSPLNHQPTHPHETKLLLPRPPKRPDGRPLEPARLCDRPGVKEN
jgi:hypothetical protein